jgi:cytochrome c biogenesis protein
VVQEGTLLVNHPIEFRGITFYQSSYGTIPGKIHLRISKGKGNPETLAMAVDQGKTVSLPGGSAQFQVVEVDDNLRGAMGPAALIHIKPEQGEEIRFWVFQRIKMLRERFPGAMLKAPILDPSSFKPLGSRSIGTRVFGWFGRGFSSWWEAFLSLSSHPTVESG